MTSGYASDTSNGSNKRTRFGDDVGAPIAHGERKSPPESIGKITAPVELAIRTIETFCSSTLHHKMTHNVSDRASDFAKKYSRWFHKDKAYQKQKDDPDFIPHSAKVKLILHPVTDVAERPGFLAVSREAAEVVKQCHLLLREPVLKVTKMNTDSLLVEAQKAFVNALPDIAELLIADEDVEKYNKHQAVADLMGFKRQHCLTFIRLKEKEFIELYKSTHSLSKFPTPNPAHYPAEPPTTNASRNNNNNGSGGEVPQPLPNATWILHWRVRQRVPPNNNLPQPSPRPVAEVVAVETTATTSQHGNVPQRDNPAKPIPHKHRQRS